MNLALREARKQRQFSQQKLAEKAGISLATVQNIESGKGNPEFSTIQSVLQALSLEIELRPQKVDIESLSQLGVPLMTSKNIPPLAMLHSSFLIAQLSRLTPQIDTLSLQSREACAVAAFLNAIQDHYPSVWMKVDKFIKIWFERYPNEISPRLRRLSLQRLADYL